jgi:hypothetical protein
LLRREQPDLVIYEAGNPGGALAAKLAGIPCAAHSFGRYARRELSDDIHRCLLGYAAEFGVPGADQILFGDPVIDICPESAQSGELLATGNRVPLRPVGWSEPGELPPGVATATGAVRWST